MQIDPTTPQGAAYIADYLGEGHGADEVEIFIHDSLTTCEICGRQFTDHDHDGDNEALDTWACWDCIGEERYSPITRCWA